jgi:cellulose synthase operon protein B
MISATTFDCDNRRRNVQPAQRGFMGAMAWLVLTLAVACGAMPAAAQDQSAAAAKSLVRSVSLTEMGLDKGIAFSGFSGYRSLYFPAPQSGLESAVLRVSLRAGAAFAGQRFLQISVGQTVVLSHPIAATNASDTLTVPVDPKLAEDGFLRVTLRYSGALNADRCLDERVAGDFLSILPDTALEMRLSPSAFADVRSIASLLPRDVYFLLPERDMQRMEIAAVLRMAAVLRRRGSTVSLISAKAMPTDQPGTWSRGLILIGTAPDFRAEIVGNPTVSGGITALTTAAGPALLLNGEGAAIAAPLLNSRWRALADGPQLAVNSVADSVRENRSLTFEDLGFDIQGGDLNERVQFDTTFSSDQLPRGARLDSIRLELAVGAASDEGEATVFAFLNSRLLGSRRVSGAVPTVLSIGVPEGLLGRDNTLSVRVQRPARPGACARPGPGEPVQLLPSSSLELSSGNDVVGEFFNLPQLFRGGLDIIMPTEPALLREALAHLTPTVIDLIPDEAPVTLRFETWPKINERPFIVVSRSEPAESDPRLRFNQGALTINRADGKLLLDLSNGETAPTIAQVLHTPKTAGLWLRPGRTLPERGHKPVRLDRGDIAVIDTAGVALAFSTGQKQTVNVVYHEIRSWTDIAAEYRPWIVGVVWLLLTAVFVRALSLMYRRRRGK